MEVINLPRGEKFITAWETRDIVNVVSDFCGEEFAAGVERVIDELHDAADYETLKFNSDMDAYEAENESFRDALTQIDTLLIQFSREIDGAKNKTKLVNDRIRSIHQIINEVI